MEIIWFGYIFEVGILALLKPFILDFDSLGLIAVSIHVLFTLVVLFFLNNRNSLILICAFISRVLLLVLDIYGRKLFFLPHSGSDSEMYYAKAILISKNLTLLGSTNGKIYSDINGVLFYLIGPQRMFGQYMNVLLGISTVLIVYKILHLLNFNIHVKNTILMITAFFPTSIIMSAIFVREAFPTFFVSISLYYFIKWFEKNNIKDVILSFILLGIASMFHSGVIGIALGYTFAFLFFKVEQNKFKFNRKTVVSFIIVSMIFSLAFTVFNSYIFGKFQNVDEISDVYETATSDGNGGSAYLVNLKVNNLLQLLIFSPINSLYFLSSPVPMDWRGFIDIFTFFTDSIFYIGTIIYFLANRKYLRDNKALAISIVIMIIGATFIFGIGVSNAGTALRHRQKLVPLFLILTGIMMNEKDLYKKSTGIIHDF